MILQRRIRTRDSGLKSLMRYQWAPAMNIECLNVKRFECLYDWATASQVK